MNILQFREPDTRNKPNDMSSLEERSRPGEKRRRFAQKLPPLKIEQISESDIMDGEEIAFSPHQAQL
jgi:hypothetical protein